MSTDSTHSGVDRDSPSTVAGGPWPRPAGLGRSRTQQPDDTKWDRKYGGILVAAVGFALTRIAVLPAVHLDVTPVQFLAGDILPLVLGLGITLAGIGLSISTLPRSVVNTIATWCLLGTAGMAVVAGVVVVQVSLYLGVPPLEGVWATSLLSNLLLAGAIGGLLVGVRSATTQQQRTDLARQSRQATILNRLLRHEVLNEVAVIQGYASQLREGDAHGNEAALEQIHQGATQVRDAIDDVGFLTRSQSSSDSFGAVPVDELVDSQADAIREAHPEAEITVETTAPGAALVEADAHLQRVFRQLFENAVQHTDAATPRVDVAVTSHDTHVQVRVADNGPGLPAAQQAILRDGDLPDHDDPSTGFGLPLVRMLVSQYRGTVAVDTDPGTTVTLAFPRATDGGRSRPESAIADRVGVDPRQLGYAALAALAAGAAMGATLFALTDTLPAVGGLYGVQSFGVGWILHLFHSVVFGFAFAAVLSRPPLSGYAASLPRCVALGLGFGVVLWAGAAGVVMPVWLNAVGIPAPIPQLTVPSLLGHAIWGLSLGALYGSLDP